MKKLLHKILITTVSVSIISSSAVNAASNSFNAINSIIYTDLSATATECADVTQGSGSSSLPSTVSVATDFTLGEDSGQRPVELLKHLIADFGFKDFQAAGIIGNFMHETGTDDLRPDVNQGGAQGPPTPVYTSGNAYGWAQWDGGRKKAFVDFSVSNGYMASANVSATDAANYAYLTYELTKTSESKVVSVVKATTTAEQAAIQWLEVFERAGVSAVESRVGSANSVLNAYKNNTGVVVSNDAAVSDTDQTDSCPASSGVGSSQSAKFGEVAFPLKGDQSVVTNPGMFNGGTADQGGHPYIAYDILTPSGTETVAFASGVVTYTSVDRCGGKFLTIWNEEAKLGVTYMHLSDHIKEGTTVKAGEHVGTVGSEAAGCGTEHLHIDVATDRIRQGCARTGCTIQDHFRDIGEDLYNTYQALPKNGDEA